MKQSSIESHTQLLGNTQHFHIRPFNKTTLISIADGSMARERGAQRMKAGRLALVAKKPDHIS